MRKKINNWYTQKFLQRSRNGKQSNAEINLLANHIERRKALFDKHTSEYIKLFDLPEYLAKEQYVQSKINEIQQRQKEERKALQTILNKECSEIRIWQFPYEILDKDPEIEKRNNRYFNYGLYFILFGLGYNFTNFPTFKILGFQFQNLVCVIGIVIVISSLIASSGDND
jgi:hypothetical protein